MRRANIYFSLQHLLWVNKLPSNNALTCQGRKLNEAADQHHRQIVSRGRSVGTVQWSLQVSQRQFANLEVGQIQRRLCYLGVRPRSKLPGLVHGLTFSKRLLLTSYDTRVFAVSNHDDKAALALRARSSNFCDTTSPPFLLITSRIIYKSAPHRDLAKMSTGNNFAQFMVVGRTYLSSPVQSHAHSISRECAAQALKSNNTTQRPDSS